LAIIFESIVNNTESRALHFLQCETLNIKGIFFLTAVNVGYRTEIKQGAEILAQKINEYRPKIAVFNGKGRSDFFCGMLLLFLEFRT